MKPSVENHFTTNSWPRGEVRWHLHVLPDDNVRDMVASHSDDLKSSGLLPIPPEWLHMTILQIGSTRQVTDAQAGDIVRMLGPVCAAMRVPRLVAGPAFSWSASAVMQVSPEPDVRLLFDASREAVAKALGPKAPKPGAAFVPHISMAYSSDYYNESKVISMLARRPVKPTPFRASSLHLVKQVQTPPYYKWDLVAEMPIGQE